MQITATILDKVIKQAISNELDNCVYEYFDTATLKAAKVPAIGKMTKAIFEDAKFQARLAKALTVVAELAVEDCIYDEMGQLELPQIEALVTQCEAAYTAKEAEVQATHEAEEVKRMVKTLERAGFKIVKA